MSKAAKLGVERKKSEREKAKALAAAKYRFGNGDIFTTSPILAWSNLLGLPLQPLLNPNFLHNKYEQLNLHANLQIQTDKIVQIPVELYQNPA